MDAGNVAAASCRGFYMDAGTVAAASCRGFYMDAGNVAAASCRGFYMDAGIVGGASCGLGCILIRMCTFNTPQTISKCSSTKSLC